MSRFFRKIGVTFKKRRSSRASRIAATSAAIGRAGGPISGLSTPRRLIFLDETWTKTNMTRLRGWATKGERLHRQGPAGTLEDGDRSSPLFARIGLTRPACSMVPSTASAFAPMSSSFLSRPSKPGDVVILDNLGSHKGKAVRRAIRDVGARLVFLPKYSPDLNPIEAKVFAKFKTLLRKVGARTYEAISDASAEILAQYQPAECAAYIKKTQAMRRAQKQDALGHVSA